MATTVDYIEFVMDSIGDIPEMEFRYKKMFGEYCVYANEKPVLLVCDNTVYVKMLPCMEVLMGEMRTKPPYDGARPYYLLDIEDNNLTEKVIRLLEQNTPLPKPRKTRKVKQNNTSEKPLVDREYLLEKLPGKYGWTYTIIPEIKPDPKAAFTWVKVRGTIDGYPITDYRLMPTGDAMPSGKAYLFLAVNAVIRKKIQKQAGDYVHIILYPDNVLPGL